MPFSFWRLLSRLFGKGEKLALRPPAARAVPAGPSKPLVSVESYDFAAEAEYPVEERATLSDNEQIRLNALKIRVYDRFWTKKVEIPVFPSRAAQISRILSEPDFDIGQLVQLAQRDPMISASVLRAANSAAFAGITRVESLRDAIVRLGAQTVAAIATAVTARGLFEEGAVPHPSPFGPAWNRLWLHSVTTAFAAGSYASSSRKGDLEQSFLGGMLHDIGKTIGLRVLSGLLLEGETAETKLGVSGALLAAVLEAVHVDIGKEVATSWNLPEFVVAACANHHRPATPGDRTLNIIRVVSGLDELSTNPQSREGLDGEVRGAAGVLGLDGYMLRALASERRTAATKAAALY